MQCFLQPIFLGVTRGRMQRLYANDGWNFVPNCKLLLVRPAIVKGCCKQIREMYKRNNCIQKCWLGTYD